MSAPVVRLDELGALDLLASPVWIVDLDLGARTWVNLACLPLWRVASREELLARPVVPPSPTSRTRLDALRRRFEQGHVSIDRWTIYPDEAPPFIADTKSRGIFVARPDGPPRFSMLIEARLVGPDEVDPLERRSVEALRYLGELVSFYAEDGAAIMRNPAAVRALGDPARGDQFAAAFADPAQAAEARERLARGETYRADTLLATADGPQWFETEARVALDPATGKPGLLVTQRDIRERRARSERLAAQTEALRTLAAPVIRVAPGTLALPLVGALDQERIDVALAVLLAHSGGESITRVVIDLTGADVIDAAVAAGLLRIVRVLRLRGVSPAFSGIRPALARAIVEADLDLAGVRCHQSLADALR